MKSVVAAVVWMLALLPSVWLGLAAADAGTLSDYTDHPCLRPCRAGAAPMVCEYELTVENYHTLSKACYNCPFNASDCSRPHCVPGDGAVRTLLVVNRRLPGPAINVCQGDILQVTVHNRLESGQGTTIHWHGQHVREAQHMDGTSMVTQCPIPPFTSFQYKLQADVAGTHFWHAHMGLQRADGVAGPLVVRVPRDRHAQLYQHDLPEHVLMLQDWTAVPNMDVYTAQAHRGGDDFPDSLIINGRGTFHQVRHPDGNSSVAIPPPVFHVSPGQAYRFRVISNAVQNCPVEISVDNHTLTVIASDGHDIQPLERDSFIIYGGERFDFVLRANSMPENYWLRATGVGGCGKYFKKAKTEAVLRYQGAPEELPSAPTDYRSALRGGRTLNPYNVPSTPDAPHVDTLTSLDDDDDTLTSKPDRVFYLAVDFYAVNNPHAHHPLYYPVDAVPEDMVYKSPQMNYISNILPNAPLLTQYKDLQKSSVCNAETMQRNCSQEFCQCSHVLSVAVGDVVEVVIVDEGQAYWSNHPFHLHGYSFRVLGIDKVSKELNGRITLAEVKQLDREGRLPRKLQGAIKKDTVTVPDGGYTIFRFKADNPGFWLFHCHSEFHAEGGMALVFQVGHPDEMRRPPSSFPRCGNWHPGMEDTPHPSSAPLLAPGALLWALAAALLLRLF